MGEWVRSRLMVGKGEEAEMVAREEEQGRTVRASKFRLIKARSGLDMEPERSIEAAAEVVEAIAMAAGGRG